MEYIPDYNDLFEQYEHERDLREERQRRYQAELDYEPEDDDV